MLYREGMPGSILFAGICAVVYLVVGIRFGNELMADVCTSIGEFSVLLLIGPWNGDRQFYGRKRFFRSAYLFTVPSLGFSTITFGSNKIPLLL